MSRAFVSDKEDWNYCPKAGERCLHADPEKSCRETSCPHYEKQVRPAQKNAGDRTVRRRRKDSGSAAGGTASNATAAGGTSAGSQARPTRRANIKPPRRWGGRNG